MITRWILAAFIGTTVAGATGVLAWLLSPVAPEISAIVFGITALPFGVTLGWLITVAPKTLAVSPHQSDSAERTWMNSALAGTATDLVTVIGLGLATISIVRVELPTQLILLGLLLLAFASTATRYAVARVHRVRA